MNVHVGIRLPPLSPSTASDRGSPRSLVFSSFAWSSPWPLSVVPRLFTVVWSSYEFLRGCYQSRRKSTLSPSSNPPQSALLFKYPVLLGHPAFLVRVCKSRSRLHLVLFTCARHSLLAWSQSHASIPRHFCFFCDSPTNSR